MLWRVKMLVTELKAFADRCSGCFACYNACPKNAIKMDLNDEGFFYPIINKGNCVNCGRCVSVCQLSNESIDINNDFKGNYYYSLKSDDDIRSKSSSGGTFFQIAQYVIKRNGIVYGAAFDSRVKRIVHLSTEQTSLEAIMRSKYVQSEIGKSYEDVKIKLNDGLFVLFSGTPCQIRGLRKYLGKDYSNLITMDFVCHGVPSTGFFGDMVRYYEKEIGANITEVTFREKDLGWRKQVLKFYFDNNKVITNVSSYYYYYYLFLRNVTLRKSCYTCQDAENKVSDITVMDYWQIKEDDDKGVSALKINSEKGMKVLNEILSAADINEITQENIGSSFVNHSKNKNYRRSLPTRNSFFKYYIKNGFEKTKDKWFPSYFRYSKFTGKIRVIGGRIKKNIKRGLGKNAF